jgi:2-amino-4-hydroxy-6-hydroxymethyldihydropteridine diphosphokinase
MRPLPFHLYAFISLGSNLGDSRRIIHQAFAALQACSEAPLRQSSLWQTAPVDCPPASPLFLNAIAGLLPRRDETPENLLTKLKNLEKKAGRQTKKMANEPRPLDLDLIVYGAVTCQTPGLVLPHPRAHQRRFVLQPLSEIAPDLIIPGQTRTVRELLAQLPEQGILERLSLLPPAE